ncbi:MULTISPECIES: DUF1501 domain-containing protein [Methylosinus]|uniref:DUF1501 domain-containing protein n=1 Tax=Methylosinus trichosporium (strain ATCC 35070 / NCIMB 11131 / UNIQEM 75 / OB3b) TaxID=595536 RepID=A0A2D2D4Y7_METT3|nr:MULTISPECIES: DUF1501 domain-containing protein [Methylosinus]ATQ70025.1 DUF1501 domain-containing protein [Methylosinus trichosporium OB3b]
MSLNRRQLIQGFAASIAPMTSAGRVWAAPQTNARLLIVFLRGGYDAANVVIPVSSDFYYEARPRLAIARPDPLVATSALPLDQNWGLHPALRETIFPLFQQGQVAFVPFAGIHDLTRSHFETQDAIELGLQTSQTRDYLSGFMARLASVLTRARPISFTDQVPLAFHGGDAIPNFAINNLSKPGIDSRQEKLIATMYSDSRLSQQVQEGFRVRNEIYQTVVEQETQPGRTVAVPKHFELSADRIGRLMRDRFNLGFVDVGGWDTHANQGAADGYLADRIRELGRGLKRFAEQIGPQWDNTVIVVLSEFGRTFRENGSRGTDHGHGSVYWVLGGGVRGGRIMGEQIDVDQRHLFENRDYPVLTDYRSLLGGLFQRMFGLNKKDVEHVFAAAQPIDVGLI